MRAINTGINSSSVKYMRIAGPVAWKTDPKSKAEWVLFSPIQTFWFSVPAAENPSRLLYKKEYDEVNYP